MAVPHIRVDDVVERFGEEPSRRSRGAPVAVACGAVITVALDLTTDATHAQVLLWVPVVAAGAIVGRRPAAAALVVLAVASGALGMPRSTTGAVVLAEAAGRAASLSAVAAASAWMAGAGRELARRSRSDAMTGLLNGVGLRAALERERQRSLRSGRPLTLVYLDLDGMKRVNDRFGHAAGDELLRRFARHLDGQRRTVDVAARLGGDEFALLLPDTDACGASEALARLFRDVTGVGLAMSAGAVTWATPPPAPEMLVVADEAMYEVKRRGGSDWMLVDGDGREVSRQPSGRLGEDDEPVDQAVGTQTRTDVPPSRRSSIQASPPSGAANPRTG